MPVEARIFIAALAFRVLSALAAYLANITLPQYQDQGFGVFPRQDHPFWDTFARYDSGWYQAIAAHGYEYKGVGRNNLAFFPAYPLLMRAAGSLLGGRQQDYYFAGIVISWLSFAGAMTMLYRLALLDLPRPAAMRAVMYAAAFPFAFFFGVVYSESLFFLALVTAAYAFRTQAWVGGAAAGAVMTATRVTGLMAVPGLALIAWQAARDPSAPPHRGTPAAPHSGTPAPPAPRHHGTTAPRHHGTTAPRHHGTTAPPHPDVSAPPHLGDRVRAVAAAAGSVAGLGAYSAYNAAISPSPFTWYQSITFWGYHPGNNPFSSVVGLLSALASRPYQFLTTERMAPYDTLNAFAALGALALVPLIWKRFNAGYALIVVAALLLPLSSGQFEGLGRYTSVQFPVALALASLGGNTRHLVMQAVSLVLYLVCLSLFVTVHPLF